MKKKVLVLAIAATCAATTQAQANFSTRIIGGTPAQATAYPWMVSLRDSEGQFCGASLVNESWVMTAAHCVEDMSANRVHAVVGNFDLTKVDAGEEKRSAKRILIHPDRNASNDDHDIAMIELESPVSKTLVTAADATLTNSVAAGTPLTVMGWGTQSEGGDSPDQLHEVQVPLVDQQECKTQFAATGGEITDNMMCAGLAEGGKDSCQGDSGGPLVHQKDGQWYQLGVVSWGEGCAQPNSPGVYARVATYHDWVNGVIAGTATGTEPDGSGGSDGDYGDWDDWDGDDGDWGDDYEETQSFELPYWLDFYSEEDGAVEETLTFVNNTDAPVSVTDITIDNDAFVVTQNGCDAQVAVDASCEIKVTYTPTGEDEMQYANLSLSVDGGEAIEIELFGLEEFDWLDELNNEQSYGLPYWLDFFSVDEQPAEQTLRFLNTSENAVTVTSVNSDNAAFAVNTNGCQAPLDPKQFCEIEMTYTPTGQEEWDEAELTIETDSGESFAVELYGENLAAFPDFGDEDEDWFASGDEWEFSEDGSMCSLDSSTMEEGDASRLEAEFTGPGVLEFDVSMENDSEDNRLTYMVDGQTVRTLSGAVANGTKHRTELSEGKHKVSWVYKKNTSSSAVPTVNNIQFRKTGDSTQTPSNNAESGSGGGGAMGLPLWMSLFGLTLIRRFFK